MFCGLQQSVALVAIDSYALRELFSRCVAPVANYERALNQRDATARAAQALSLVSASLQYKANF